MPSVQQEQLDCEDCIKNGGDRECDRVHCHKGDVPDTNVGELISRQEAIKAILGEPPEVNYPIYYAEKIRELPSVHPRKGKWLIYSTFDDCYYAKCDQCHETQVFYYNKPLTNFCPNCGCRMEEGDSE